MNNSLQFKRISPTWQKILILNEVSNTEVWVTGHIICINRKPLELTAEITEINMANGSVQNLLQN